MPQCFNMSSAAEESILHQKASLCGKGLKQVVICPYLGFGHMTRELMTLADGKVILVLEGGYHLPSICDSAEMCVKALLGEYIPAISEEEMQREPCKDAIDCLENTINIQSKCNTPIRIKKGIHYLMVPCITV